jgi:hypothetical protein
MKPNKVISFPACNFGGKTTIENLQTIPEVVQDWYRHKHNYPRRKTDEKNHFFIPNDLFNFH